VKVLTRRGNDWTKRFRKIASDASEIEAGSAILDGEVVVPSANGVSDFSVLQNELKGRSTKIVLVAFDLLFLNGHDLRKLPLLARKAELKPIIDGTAVQFSDSFEIDGREMYQHACKLGLEGVISKMRDGAYVSGRGNIWVKKTCQHRETLTIAGFALDGQKWDGIYLARRKGKGFIYAGKVDHGFDNKSAADLRKRLTPLIRKTQPYTKRIAHRGIGWNRSFSPRSSTAPSLPKGRCGIPSFWVCAMTSETCWKGSAGSSATSSALRDDPQTSSRCWRGLSDSR
jgi:bifunctional non-homologous end joining protein LigD